MAVMSLFPLYCYVVMCIYYITRPVQCIVLIAHVQEALYYTPPTTILTQQYDSCINLLTILDCYLIVPNIMTTDQKHSINALVLLVSSNNTLRYRYIRILSNFVISTTSISNGGKLTAGNRHKQNSRFCKEIREDNFRFWLRRVHEDASQGMYMSKIEICFFTARILQNQRMLCCGE